MNIVWGFTEIHKKHICCRQYLYICKVCSGVRNAKSLSISIFSKFPYLKGHKSQGSLCSVVRSLVVSLVRGTNQGTRSPIELFWVAKKWMDNHYGLSKYQTPLAVWDLATKDRSRNFSQKDKKILLCTETQHRLQTRVRHSASFQTHWSLDANFTIA